MLGLRMFGAAEMPNNYGGFGESALPESINKSFEQHAV